MTPIAGTIVFGIYVVAIFIPWIAEVIADLRK